MRIATWVVGVPVVVVTVIFAVANRHTVTFSLDPLPWAVDLPLFIVVIGAFVVGLLIAAGIGMLRLSRARGVVRRQRREIERLERDLATARDKAAHHVHDPAHPTSGALVVPGTGKAA
jgi:uncharacterized integral membrane protein